MLRYVLPLLTLMVGLSAWSGEPRSSHTRVSVNGLYTVRLLEYGAGRCALEVSKESGLAWRLESCVGGLDDLYYVSEDGERVWVLKPLVEKGTRAVAVKKGRGKRKSTPAWANAVVAVLCGREGAVKEVRLPELVSHRDFSDVRQLKGHFKWLEGMLGVPGRSPRLTDAGVVEFETVGGKTHQLKF